MLRDLEEQGWAVVASNLAPDVIAALRETVFTPGAAGTRCLLDEPRVASVAREIRAQLVGSGILSARAVAIQAIAFNKTAETNWKVTWHQDVMFPFAQPVRVPGYDLGTKKDGVDYARPPRTVLEQMLAMRLHLDDCDETNGPLRVAPGSHRAGILKSTEIAGRVEQHGEVACLARTGEAVLMRPLLLHASSTAREPRHRRVLHVVYYAGEPIAERWHRGGQLERRPLLAPSHRNVVSLRRVSPQNSPARMKILIVEDQRRLGQFLKKSLTEHAHTATWVATCREARDAMCETSYDLVLLDLGLPDGDGLDLLREWRQGGFTQAVLILSARDAVHDRIKGLDLGADDYLPKPFSVEEVLARVRSLLRRQSSVKETVLEHRYLKLDLLGRTLEVHGKPVPVTAREFALIEVFLQHPGRILTRTLISEKIWESHFDVDTNLLDVYMSKLRAKLDTDPAKPLFRTVRGVGYQML